MTRAERAAYEALHPGQSSRGRVLVVEDETDLAWLEQFNLESEGYQVWVAHEGRAALGALTEFAPHVVVLDVMLPLVDGWSVLAKLQEFATGDRPKVIIVSALNGEGDRARAEALGAGTFLAKPFEMDDLIDMVARALQP